MRRRLLLIGILVVGIALLSGCDLLDQIIDSITGGGTPGGGTPGGGTPSPGAITSVSIRYNLDATISERLMPTRPVDTKAGAIDMEFFRPYGGSYNAATRTFTNNWDNQVGDFSNTHLEVRLNAAEDTIEYFYARQQHGAWGWTYFNEIRGHNIPYSHTDGDSRYFIVTGTGAHATVDLLAYKGWARESEGYGASNPIEWLDSLSDITPDDSNTITIRLNK